MYSDLFDHLGGAAGGGGGGGSSSSSSGGGSSGTTPMVSFKAGKMEMMLQENGKYWVSADTRRGEIRLIWKSSSSSSSGSNNNNSSAGGNLHYEWYDRREKTVVDKGIISTENSGKLEKVQNTKITNNTNTSSSSSGGGSNGGDRIYVWTKSSPNKTDSSAPAVTEHEMFWMQDANDSNDEELVAKFNKYLADPASADPNAASAAAAAASTAAAASASPILSRSSQSDDDNKGATATIKATDGQQQVDALSSILENLGMPHNDAAVAASSGGTAAVGTAGASSTLTMADLQGAMAGLQQQQVAAVGGGGGPPLQELVTPSAVTSLMEEETVRNRLMELLPEEQRDAKFLEENLRSPQVQQTLRSLTAALLPDDNGSLDGYHSILANFSLRGGQEALVRNNHNPIQAFLDCIMTTVREEEAEEKKKKEEEQKE